MFLLSLCRNHGVDLCPHALLVGERVAQHVQGFTVRLSLGVCRYAVAAPVVAPLAVRLVQIPEIRFHHLGLRVLYPRRGQLVAHGQIQRGHGLYAVVVTLQLVRPQHLPCQLRAVLCGVAQCLCYQCRGLVRAYGVAYGVVAAGVEHHFQTQTV